MKKKESLTYPMILVFYVHRDMLAERKIMEPFVNSVNQLLEEKKSNVLAFFLPTDGDERVECINPLIVAEPDMARINAIVEDITQRFSIGVEVDSEIPDEDIILDEKECTCNGGECNCNKILNLN